jgi:Xaa-Pro aminopeptidase
MRYTPLPSKFHQANRRKLAETIGPDAVAIIDTADVIRRAGDFEYPFRPDSNFYYLTGIDQPAAVLVLMPGHPNERLREVLFLQETNDLIALWAGHRYSQEEGTERSGVTTTMWLSELDDILNRAMGSYHTVYLNAQSSLEPGPLGPSERRAEGLRRSLPMHRLHSAVDLLNDQRAVKKPEEVDQIRRAIEITGLGLTKAWAAVKPGLPEYALEAELTAEFTRQGATGPAFSPIIAAGANSTVIHYATGGAGLEPDSTVLFDVGAEAGYYAADISRVVPTSGRFTKRQRAVYEVVYRAQQHGISLHKPGATILEIDVAMREVLLKGLVELGELTTEQAAGAESQRHLRKYYAHISHHLGLDVHDSGLALTRTADAPLVPGMVVTCEPGLYLAKEGIGVRLEDDILITKAGHEVLSAGIPSRPEEIEHIMSGGTK